MFINCILFYCIKVNIFTRLECFAAKYVCYTNTYLSSVLCANSQGPYCIKILSHPLAVETQASKLRFITLVWSHSLFPRKDASVT